MLASAPGLAVSNVQPDVPAISSIVPAVDHHQHLLSPAGAAWLNRIPAPAEAVPGDVAALLAERARRWNDAAGLAELYLPDATVLSDLDPVFHSGREGREYLSKRFARPFDLVPRAFRQVGESADVAGFYTRGSGTDRRRIGYFYMRLARGRDGGWRIAAEVPTFPGPADAVPITADRMIELLDEAGIDKAVVLSDAYWFDSVFQPESADNYDRVRAENDWTAAEAARFPRRLIAFCSFNPLKDYAARELRRCAADGKWRGVKIHLRSSGVDLKRPEHVRKLRSIVAAANQARLPIVIHARGGEDYGADHARVLVDQILPAAPDVVVQIAHLWGGENYSKAALATYADAVAAGHPATRKLYFDVSDAALVANGSSQVLAEIVAAMRKIGLDRMVYGSDAPMEGHPPPAASWLAFRQSMPLTEAEFRAIAANVAPYLK